MCVGLSSGGCGLDPIADIFRDQSFVEIDHEIFSMEIPPFTDSRRVVVSSCERINHLEE